jgi:hypothetical protein
MQQDKGFDIDDFFCLFCSENGLDDAYDLVDSFGLCVPDIVLEY